MVSPFNRRRLADRIPLLAATTLPNPLSDFPVVSLLSSSTRRVMGPMCARTVNASSIRTQRVPNSPGAFTRPLTARATPRPALTPPYGLRPPDPDSSLPGNAQQSYRDSWPPTKNARQPALCTSAWPPIAPARPAGTVSAPTRVPAVKRAKRPLRRWADILKRTTNRGVRRSW
jgi:hypothetical protein